MSMSNLIEGSHLSSEVTLIAVSFKSSFDPFLSRCTHSIPQLFNSQGEVFAEANQYLRLISRRLKKKSLLTVSEHIKEFIKWLEISNLKLIDVTDYIFDAYVDAQCIYMKQNGKRLSWNTVNARTAGSYRFLIWCFEQGYSPHLSPTDSSSTKWSTRKKYEIRGHPSKKLRDHTKFLLLKDAILFIKTLALVTGEKDHLVKRRNTLIGKLMLQSGLRVSEIANFPLNDLPEINHQGHSSIARVIGKGGKSRAFLIPNELLLDLWEYVDLDREVIVEKIDKKDSIDKTLFINKFGKKLTSNWIEKIFARTSKLLGIKTTPHTLRHTYGTYHYLINRDLTALASLMGHESESTTSQYYVHTAILASYSESFQNFQQQIDSLAGVKP